MLRPFKGYTRKDTKGRDKVRCLRSCLFVSLRGSFFRRCRRGLERPDRKGSDPLKAGGQTPFCPDALTCSDRVSARSPIFKVGLNVGANQRSFRGFLGRNQVQPPPNRGETRRYCNRGRNTSGGKPGVRRCLPHPWLPPFSFKRRAGASPSTWDDSPRLNEGSSPQTPSHRFISKKAPICVL